MTTHPTRFHLRLLPVTRAGWSSLVLAGLSILSLSVFVRLVDAGHVGYDPLLLATMAGFLGLAFAGAIAGVVDLVRGRERALVVILPILYGLLWAGFLAGEFTNPH
ncbi:MAG: hypothetical protein AB1627_12550 [Chloroflexota bacterium]